MKKRNIAMLFGAALLVGCGAKTMTNMNVDTNDIQYKQDKRTGLCYAFVAVGRSMSVVPQGLGMTNVPCTPEVLALVKK